MHEATPRCGNEFGNVILLNRSLCGLKQAGRAWTTSLSETLKEQGFEQCLVGSCVFRQMDDGEVRMVLVVQVDDVIIVGTSSDCESLPIILAQYFLQNPSEKCVDIWDDILIQYEP